MRLPVTRIGAGASRIGHAPGPLETSAEHCPSGDPRQVPTGSRPPFPALGFWPIHPGPRRVSNSLDAGLINLSLRPFECQDRAIDPSGLDKPFCPKSQDRLASRVDFIAREKTARSSNRRPSQGLSLAVCTRPGRGKNCCLASPPAPQTAAVQSGKMRVQIRLRMPVEIHISGGKSEALRHPSFRMGAPSCRT